MNALSNVLYLLDNASHNSELLQTRMLELVAELKALGSKKAVLESGIDRVFAHEVKGLDRGSLVAWVQEYTPIRIKFKANGQFEKLSWSASHVKSAKAEDRDEWGIAGLTATPWYDFAPERTRKATAGSLDRALKAAAREIAKVAAECGDLPGTLDAYRESVAKAMAAEVMDVMSSDKFVAWAEARAADIKADEQAKATDQGRRTASTQLVLAKLAA